MRYKVTFVVGLALGYVLGTAAGRERYEQLKRSARAVAQNPAVRNAVETAGHTGRDVAGKAFVAVGDRVEHAMPNGFGHRLRSLRERGDGRDDEWGTSNT
ncbi:YtxH domain-containing protein [Streptomyces antimicrobicus]|uniref:YtxH domain-containing protein n=1 Tax=Streptomyces antimicrobicus TaxID=2883108 RepID=A0ABS8BEL1_9ACTN|nr:YtxH domain-containing protein [Streptomyces antimicrobicus]MCB5182964.1 YtxH domain-containing protein [Streptomyces antimicrobicus]